MPYFGMKPSPDGTYVVDDGEKYRLTSRAIISQDITEKLGYTLYKAVDENHNSRICMSYPDGSTTIILPISDVIIEYNKKAELGSPFLGKTIISSADYEDYITVGVPKNVVSWMNTRLFEFISDDMIYIDDECQKTVWFNVKLSQEAKAIVWEPSDNKVIDCEYIGDFMQEVQQNVIGIGTFGVYLHGKSVCFELKRFQGIDLTKETYCIDPYKWESTFIISCSNRLLKKILN